MNKRVTASFRQTFIVGYTNMLKRVRKGSKGLRNQYFSIILLVGDTPTANTLTQIANSGGITLSNAYQRIGKAIRAGYVYKENKRYYLTSEGKTAYNALCVESDKAMNEIKRYLLEEIERERLRDDRADLERLS